jgi:hypothetical protein
MSPESRRYLLGSLVSVDIYRMGEIVAMDEKEVTVLLPEGEKKRMSWDYIGPIHLNSDSMMSMGFTLIKKLNHPHHTEYMMDIKINGKYYTARGIELRDRSIWSFNNVSVRYLHQVQSLIWIIEPTYKFKITDQK